MIEKNNSVFKNFFILLLIIFLPMFEFETSIKMTNENTDIYDLELAIAISRSFVKAPGSQILNPSDVDKIIKKKVENILKL